jgi:4'-phosphopantetheinyl transferase
MDTLNPVILRVPKEKAVLSGREKVKFLSSYARIALSLSAGYSQVSLGEIVKDNDGVPIPSGEHFWSITHKPLFVGGVVSPGPIGIDLEHIRPCSPNLFRKVASNEEWTMCDADPNILFFRFWTAKEAVIKASGSKIKNMLKCRVAKICDENNLFIEYEGKTLHVEHQFFFGHIASIVKNKYQINWNILPELSLDNKS